VNIALPEVDLATLLPEGILLTTAAAILFLRGARANGTALAAAMAAAAVSLLLSLFPYPGAAGGAFDGLVGKDAAALLFLVLTDLAALAAMALSRRETVRDENGETYYGLVLFALLGMHVMVFARDLLVIFLGMEILALPLYVLAGFDRGRKEGMEGSVKYFLLGGFSSALFLLGTALYYGAVGTTGMDVLSASPAAPLLLAAGLALVVAALGFKITAVPFHMWAPDVYEGAPLGVAALLSAAPKAAAFAVLLRIGLAVPGAGTDFLPWAGAVMAGASMAVGNLAALRQENLVRMLAYSGVAQGGYMLMGLPALAGDGPPALAFYLLVYILMNLGAFAVAVTVAGGKGGSVNIGDLSGLASRRPLLAFAMAVFMVSLAGLPPTGGFFAKFYMFKAALGAGWLFLVLLAVGMTVVSLFYYLRVVAVMYMTDEKGGRAVPSGAPLAGGLAALLALATLAAGILPSWIFQGIGRVFP